jgi:RimJ/RimL family protein N-acetyltransferase
VHTLTAVLKRANGRSQRLLERLGFSLVSAEDAGLGADEILTERRVAAP